MKCYSELDLDELEKLSAVGGSDLDGTRADSAVASTITSLVVTEALTQAVTAVTVLTLGASTLFSCSKNKVVCKRKK